MHPSLIQGNRSNKKYAQTRRRRRKVLQRKGDDGWGYLSPIIVQEEQDQNEKVGIHSMEEEFRV